MQRWQISVAPSLYCQRLCFGAALFAALLLVLGIVYNYFSWLLAGIGLCLLALISLKQGFYFFTVNAKGRGYWGPESEPFMLTSPVLSTPWLLMLRIRSVQGLRWLFIWQDSVDEDNWCRLRRIGKAAISVNEQQAQVPE